MKQEYCEWIYRPNTNNSHWAYTTCKSGFNPLTRIRNSEPYVRVAGYCNNIQCPICKKPIKICYELNGK